MTVYDDALRSIQEGMTEEPVDEIKGSKRLRKKQGRLDPQTSVDDQIDASPEDEAPEWEAQDEVEADVEDEQREELTVEPDDQATPSHTPSEWDAAVAQDYDTRAQEEGEHLTPASDEPEEAPAQELHVDEPEAEAMAPSASSLFQAIKSSGGPAFAKIGSAGANE